MWAYPGTTFVCMNAVAWWESAGGSREGGRLSANFLLPDGLECSPVPHELLAGQGVWMSEWAAESGKLSTRRAISGSRRLPSGGMGITISRPI